MDLGMFDKKIPSLKTRAQLQERRFDMTRSYQNSERYVIPMHRKNVTNGCRILERIFCRIATMILVHSIGKASDHLKERED